MAPRPIRDGFAERQDRRRADLENFLNSYTLDHASKALFPFLDRHRIVGKSMDAHQAAEFLAERFRTGPTQGLRTRWQAVRIQSWKAWSEKRKPESLQRVMEEMRRRFQAIERHLVGAYVHGSLSDLKTTGYSDVDLLAVLRQDAATDSHALLEVRAAFLHINKAMRRWDPLQHHGVFVVAETDLEAYCQSWLPTAALRHATQLVGPTRVEFWVRDSRIEAEQTLRLHVDYLERLLSKANRAYHFKEMCSIVMLLPALVLGKRGVFLYKPDSYPKARRLFRKESWKAMDMATHIRQEWSQRPGWTGLALKAPTFWPSSVASMLEPARQNTEFVEAVRTLLKDPVLHAK